MTSSDSNIPPPNHTRRQILGLKLMVYTAAVLLAGGFFYHYQALQSAQDKFNREMQGLREEMELIMKDRDTGYGHPLEETLVGMKGALSNLENESQEVRRLAEKVNRESEELLETLKAQQHRR